MMHKHPTAGHLGTNAMFYKIAERYYWDQMYRDIKEYVRTCEEYQKRLKSKRKESLYLFKLEELLKELELIL